VTIDAEVPLSVSPFPPCITLFECQTPLTLTSSLGGHTTQVSHRSPCLSHINAALRRRRRSGTLLPSVSPAGTFRNIRRITVRDQDDLRQCKVLAYAGSYIISPLGTFKAGKIDFHGALERSCRTIRSTVRTYFWVFTGTPYKYFVSARKCAARMMEITSTLHGSSITLRTSSSSVASFYRQLAQIPRGRKTSQSLPQVYISA
jgi:hypothetical protein